MKIAQLAVLSIASTVAGISIATVSILVRHEWKHTDRPHMRHLPKMVVNAFKIIAGKKVE